MSNEQTDVYLLNEHITTLYKEIKELKSKIKEAEEGKYCFGCGYPKDPESYTDANSPRICKNVMCKENELKKQ